MYGIDGCRISGTSLYCNMFAAGKSDHRTQSRGSGANNPHLGVSEKGRLHRDWLPREKQHQTNIHRKCH